jgi:hypothetical protein
MRLDSERQAALEPSRMEFAIGKIEKLGYDITFRDSTKFKFKFKGEIITFYPYSGWATGKTIEDGRGLHNLLMQIKPKV